MYTWLFYSNVWQNSLQIKKKKELCIQNVLKDMGLDILLYNPGKRKNLGQMFVYTVWSQLCKLVKDNKEKI